jgi:hypothetical protein
MYPTREKNIGVQLTIFLPTLDELFIMVYVMAIATTQLYLATPMPTGLVNLKNENQPLVSKFLFNGGPVSYGSRRQRATALSTRDAEFYAACEGAKESIWLKSLLLEIGFDVGRVSIRCDSKCALALINGEESKTAKYIDVRYFFTR